MTLKIDDANLAHASVHSGSPGGSTGAKSVVYDCAVEYLQQTLLVIGWIDPWVGLGWVSFSATR